MANIQSNKMGDSKITFWQEITQGLGKGLVWLGYISIGVIAKLAFDSRANQLTRRQIIVKSVLSMFAGYVAAVVCENTGKGHWIKVVAPVATLLGESIVLYIMTNWKKWVAKFLPGFIEEKKKEIEK